MNSPDETPAQYHFTPDTYGEMIRADLPRYDELQAAAIDAIPFAPVSYTHLTLPTNREV